MGYLISLLTSGLVAQEAELSNEQVDQNISTSLKDSQAVLEKQRQTILEEKIRLAKDWDGTVVELEQKRREVNLARMSQSDRSATLAGLTRKSEQSRRALDDLNSQLGLSASRLAIQLYPSEGESTELFEKAQSNDAGQLDARLALLEQSVARVEDMLGGRLLDSKAVTQAGEVIGGQLVEVGPLRYFLSSDGKASGEVERNIDSNTLQLSSENTQVARTLVTGEEVAVSIDLADGKARAMAAVKNSPVDLFLKGGVWVYPIAFIALIALMCAIIKVIQFLAVKSPPVDWVRKMLEHIEKGEKEEAVQLARSIQHPASTVLAAAVAYADKGAILVEEVIYEQLIGVESKLQKWLPFIAVTAAAAPLLGLLGTVTGMIGTFDVITIAGTGDAKPLAGGISEALVTTMFGLVAAIPALICHAMLSRRARGITQMTESLGLNFVNGLRARELDTQKGE